MNDIKYGISSQRREDDRLLTGGGQYTDDIRHQGALRIVFVRSPYPSAHIRAIDIQAALDIPGVVAVLTSADLDASSFKECPNPFRFAQGDGSFAIETPRPYLVRDRVRCIGEPVAMVLAETDSAALDAAELVNVEYDDLPSVVEVGAALKPEAAQLWDDRPGNIAFRWQGGDKNAVDVAMSAAAHVTRLRSYVSRVGAMPMEPRSALAYIGDDGRPVLQVAHQSPHALRNELAKMVGLERDGLRVIAGDVGGSFGMKFGPQREEVLVLWAGMHLKRAVRWTAQRSETFLCDEQARETHLEAELGLDATGRFTALRVRYQVNVGAYMNARTTTQFNNIGGISGVYAIAATAAEMVGLFTNTQLNGVYRGAGRPEATYAIERLIDVAAAEMAIDAAELRRRNLIPASAMPYKTSFLFTYDCGEFERNLDKALQLAEYHTFPARREESARRGKLRGIGLAMSIETAGGKSGDWAEVHVRADGGLSLRPGVMSVGQGHETTLSRMAADYLGVPVETIRYEQGDTDLLVNGRGNGGSSGLLMCGSALVSSLDQLIDKARALTARQFNVAIESIEYAAGSCRLRDGQRGLSFAELGAIDRGQTLKGAGAFEPTGPTFPNGCHICEVEIDPETGKVTPLKYLSVEDVGRVMNPILVEGQLAGGVAQGMGQSLLEEIRYDASGQLLSGSFMDYAMPRASDIPPLVTAHIETPTKLNPLGTKGVGEAGTVGGMSATTNAVCNALLPAGIGHLDMPATPLRVWQALRDAGYAASK